MEKIKEALLKAKNTSGIQDIRTVGKNLSAKNLAVDEDDFSSIQYVNTKSIELNPAHLEKNRIVALNKHDPTVAVFDSLRTQVLQKMEENNWRTIAVVSPTPASGKTFVAINLSISIANQPQKTAMLVDFDLRRPRVAKYLGLDVEKSLNDFLSNQAELHEIMVNPGLPRLVVLPTLNPVPNSAEILSSTKVNNLIQEVYDRYESRIIIYDLPPILNADDALIMLRKVDCVLLVVGNGLVKETEIEETMHHIPQDKLLGVVLNRGDNSPETYYY